MIEFCRLVWCGLIGLFRSRAALGAESLVLRHQLNILRRKSPRHHPRANGSLSQFYDPSLGIGKILNAAKTTGRICLGLEIDPAYVDVAVRRWQAFTGEQATLLADGRSFDAIAVVPPSSFRKLTCAAGARNQPA